MGAVRGVGCKASENGRGIVSDVHMNWSLMKNQYLQEKSSGGWYVDVLVNSWKHCSGVRPQGVGRVASLCVENVLESRPTAALDNFLTLVAA